MDQEYVYQYGFLERFAQYLLDPGRQTQKAGKTLAVLEDYFGGSAPLKDLDLLDIGCTAGLMTEIYSRKFRHVTGIDIDGDAIEYASHNLSSDNLHFFLRDAMDTGFPDESFDVVTCAHIYEHVPDSTRLMSEIYRVLKKGGICYFAAGNRFCFIEGHYWLPFLSAIPKPLAHLYLRVLRKGDFYYENHLGLWGLRKLVRKFEVVDYTKKIIEDPVKYSATEMLASGSWKQRAAKAVLSAAYFLCPTYIWILVKK
ncbi:MAG TPA: methyltransferase domain-containing protein [Desulfomonilaceae bacterium]|nr:methyltransferase domain-containing protein [Desulfomonilaceae bacterium]